jgi:CubicO group peptidase (beta-lactamase class C family)
LGVLVAEQSPFGSPEWLDHLAGFPAPPIGRSSVTIRFRLTDAQPDLDLVADLAGGLLMVSTAKTGDVGLEMRLPRQAALEFLLGSGQQRVGVFERGDVEAVGNFSLLFFVDAVLQEDPAGMVAALRDLTSNAPGQAQQARVPAAAGGTATAPPAASAGEALPRAVRVLEREVGCSTPGAQLYVSRHGQPLADIGMGLARPGVAMTSESSPLWYCCAKPLLSVALGKLWEQRRFDPELPVAHYLPQFATGGKDNITALQLLTHTGRLATGADPLHGVVAAPDAVRLRRAFDAVVPLSARTQINYSQWWAWFVLAQLIPEIDGRPYEAFVEQEILRPCRMDDTRVTLTGAEFDMIGDRLPLIHVSNLGRPQVPTWWWSTRAATTRCIPGVNTRGPVRDQGRLLEMLLAGGIAPGGRVIQPRTVAFLTARHRRGLHDRYGNADWGLGLRLECRQLGAAYTSFGSHVSPQAFGHDGLWTAVAFADPAFGLAVAIHFNGKVEHERHRERILQLADAIYADLGLD